MSKFFKWLKKDKQQEESPVVNEVPLQTADKPVSSEAELLKNDNSVAKDLIINPSEDNQSEHNTSANEFEPEDPTHNESGASLSPIENNHSYTESFEENKSIKNPEIVESEIKSNEFITASLSKNPPKEQNISLEKNEPSIEIPDVPTENSTIELQEAETIGFFSKLKRGLSRTKESIGSGIVSLFRGKAIDDELFEELETQLLVADVGMDTTVKIIKQLTESSDRKQLKDGDALYQLLKEQMADILKKVESPLTLKAESGPFVILMVGVNGVGKTTTIGKMAKQFQQQGKKVMLAAGDTFRAAAVEQLQVWGDRNNIPVVAQQTGSDSASVIFDAFQSAKAKNIDVLIADTAGRLQNKDHLMEELKKVVRVMKKIAPDAPHEIMLTLDAGTGQNAVSQTKLFNEAVGLTGISLTKLDGTAKGGVIFAIADQFNIPIRYVGIGEGIDDLRPFNSQDFVNALFVESDSQQEQTN
jgi:fused signal recognition particle receptor